MVRWLVEHGNADVHAKNNDGWTALDRAAYWGEADVQSLTFRLYSHVFVVKRPCRTNDAHAQTHTHTRTHRQTQRQQAIRQNSPSTISTEVF